MRCQHRLFVEIAAGGLDPLRPYPLGQFYCADPILPHAIEMGRIRNDVGWDMTYLDIATILTELWVAAVVFGNFLPQFSFQVRSLTPPNVLLSVGIWHPVSRVADNSTISSY